MNNDILFSNLRILRKCHQLTQIEVANLIGKDRSLIAKYESGKAVPPLNILQSFSKLYNISVDKMCEVALNENVDVVLTIPDEEEDISFSELSDIERKIILRLRLFDENTVNEVYEKICDKK